MVSSLTFFWIYIKETRALFWSHFPPFPHTFSLFITIMDEQELELLYTRQLNEELVSQTRQKINRFLENHPHDFGLETLFPTALGGNMPEDLAKLYQEVCSYYNDNVIEFDHIWVKCFICYFNNPKS
jgi:hypothetical protein